MIFQYEIVEFPHGSSKLSEPMKKWWATAKRCYASLDQPQKISPCTWNFCRLLPRPNAFLSGSQKTSIRGQRILSVSASAYVSFFWRVGSPRSQSGSFFPPAFQCPHEVERVGSLGDGGKWTCGLSRLKHKTDCLVYTFGESDHVA